MCREEDFTTILTELMSHEIEDVIENVDFN